MSTVYPFRLQGKKLICVYCCDEFEDPDLFRAHVDDNHDEVNLFTAFAHTGRNKEYLKVDCIDLKCRICLNPSDSIEELTKHLKDTHVTNEIDRLNLDYDIALHPYKLYKDKWDCVICNEKMPSLIKLARHMSTHYAQFTCDACGRCYLSIDSLNYHIKLSHSGKISCRKCWKEFPTSEERKKHLKTSLKCRPFRCVYCGERFASWEYKHKHQVTFHDVQETTYPCPECDVVFQTRKSFYNHYTAVHTHSGFTCTCCNRTFSNKHALNDHKLGHTGERVFECSICSKGFTRRRGLTQHMWVHMETKRFQCHICNKQYTQKISLKGHMKSHHPQESYDIIL